MSSNTSLFEIAKTLLTEGSLNDASKVRETCGLLALLNLMGIVDTFFPHEEEKRKEEETPSSERKDTLVRTSAEIEPSRTPDSQEGEKDSTLARLLSMVPKTLSSQDDEASIKESGMASLVGTMAKALTQKEGGLDPKVLTSLFKLLSMTKGKSPQAVTEKLQESSTAAFSSEEGESIPEEGSESSNEPVSTPKEKPASGGLGVQSSSPNPTSPDPLEIITGFLNLLAGLDLNKLKGGTSSKARATEDLSKVKEPDDKGDKTKRETGVSVTKDGKAILFPLRRPDASKDEKERDKSLHKPGLGIKRNFQKDLLKTRA